VSDAEDAARDIKVAPLHPWQTRARSRRTGEQQLHLETIQTMRDLLSWNKRHTRLWETQTARKSLQSEHERTSAPKCAFGCLFKGCSCCCCRRVELQGKTRFTLNYVTKTQYANITIQLRTLPVWIGRVTEMNKGIRELKREMLRNNRCFCNSLF
jgi:hypothetical protein